MRVKFLTYSKLKNYKNESATVISTNSEIATVRFSDDCEFNIDIKHIFEVSVVRTTPAKYEKHIKVGDSIRTNGDLDTTCPIILEGIVGSKNDDGFFIFQNKKEGEKSSCNPESQGFNYAWFINFKNTKAWLEVLAPGFKTPVVKCKCCEKKISVLYTDKINRERWCFTCLKREAAACHNCKGFSLKDELVTFDKKKFCEICFDKLVLTCEDCDKPFYKATMKKTSDDEFYCVDCFKLRFVECSACGEEIERNSDDVFTGTNGGAYCEHCFNDRFGHCDDCHRVVHREELRYNDGEDRAYCSRCWRNYSTIKDYRYMPPLQFGKLPWENILYFGVELEVNTSPAKSPEIIASKFSKFMQSMKIDKYFYLKHDGSIQGFEIVSQPCSLQFFHKTLKIKEMLAWLRENGCTSYDNTQCGLHIHVNKKFFKVIDIVKLRLFFKENHIKILGFAQRNGQGEEYCLKEEMTTKDIIRNAPQQGRYWALNMNTGGKKTIELRVFRGTLRHERLIATLQFTDALCHFAKSIGISSITHGNGKYKGNSWQLFIDWCKKQTRYDHLCKLIKRGKLR